MSTPESIPLTPGVRIGLGTTLTALGVLLAIAMTITVLALTSSDNTTGATPAAASHAVSSTPQVHYLGPRQEHAIPQSGGGTPAADPGTLVLHYTCLGAAQRCLR